VPHLGHDQPKREERSSVHLVAVRHAKRQKRHELDRRSWISRYRRRPRAVGFELRRVCIISTNVQSYGRLRQCASPRTRAPRDAPETLGQGVCLSNDHVLRELRLSSAVVWAKSRRIRSYSFASLVHIEPSIRLEPRLAAAIALDLRASALADSDATRGRS
jgi:hypothetical protein